MADDYSINAKITADTSGFEKGVNKAKKASDGLATSLNSVSKLMKTAFSVVGISASNGTITRFEQKFVKSAEFSNKSLSLLNNKLKI